MYENVLDDSKRKKSEFKKHFKISVENWQYRKKIDKLIKKLENRL